MENIKVHSSCPVGKNGIVGRCIGGDWTEQLCPFNGGICPLTNGSDFIDGGSCVAAVAVDCQISHDCPYREKCKARMFVCRLIPD